MKIYGFLYCSCIHESSYATMSLHQTKLGAYKAMNKWLNETFMKEFNQRIKFGKDRCIYNTWKVGTHEAWCIEEYEVLP